MLGYVGTSTPHRLLPLLLFFPIPYSRPPVAHICPPLVSSPKRWFPVCLGTSFPVGGWVSPWQSSVRPRSNAGLSGRVHGSRCGSSRPAPDPPAAAASPTRGAVPGRCSSYVRRRSACHRHPAAAHVRPPRTPSVAAVDRTPA